MGSGIGSLDDVYDTTISYEKGVRYFKRLNLSRVNDNYRATEKSLRSSFLAF